MDYRVHQLKCLDEQILEAKLSRKHNLLVSLSELKTIIISRLDQAGMIEDEEMKKFFLAEDPIYTPKIKSK